MQVVGPSFSPTCLPSLVTFTRAALTWCHRCMLPVVLLYTFPSSLVCRRLLPMAFLFIIWWRMHSWKADQKHDTHLRDLHYQLHCSKGADRCLQEESVYSGAIQICTSESLAQEQRQIVFILKRTGECITHILWVAHPKEARRGRTNFHFRLKYSREVLN